MPWHASALNKLLLIIHTPPERDSDCGCDIVVRNGVQEDGGGSVYTTLRKSKRFTHNTSQNSRKIFAFLTCSYLSGSWTRIPTGAKCIYILFSVFNLKRVQRCTSSKYSDFFKFQNHLVRKKFSRFLITKSCIGVQHDSTVQLEGQQSCSEYSLSYVIMRTGKNLRSFLFQGSYKKQAYLLDPKFKSVSSVTPL